MRWAMEKGLLGFADPYVNLLVAAAICRHLAAYFDELPHVLQLSSIHGVLSRQSFAGPVPS